MCVHHFIHMSGSVHYLGWQVKKIPNYSFLTCFCWFLHSNYLFQFSHDKHLCFLTWQERFYTMQCMECFQEMKILDLHFKACQIAVKTSFFQLTGQRFVYFGEFFSVLIGRARQARNSSIFMIYCRFKYLWLVSVLSISAILKILTNTK